jgi:hypothetical protein
MLFYIKNQCDVVIARSSSDEATQKQLLIPKECILSVLSEQ